LLVLVVVAVIVDLLVDVVPFMAHFSFMVTRSM
jgi:hypothetical protein